MSKDSFKLIIISALLLFTGTIVLGQKMKFEGVYSGKKMMIHNPLAPDYIGTCIQRITINGEVYPLNVSTNYMELNLHLVGLRKGDFFNMIIDHKEGCAPFIYNEQDFRSNEKNVIHNVKYDEGVIRWNTVGEVIASDFLIEYFYRDTWNEIGRVESKGAGNQQYLFTVPFRVSGENKFRIHKLNTADDSFDMAYVNDINYNFQVVSTSVTKNIYLTIGIEGVITYYQLVDQHQNIVKNGYGNSINVSNLNSGFYTLYFDNKKVVIVKK